MFFSFLILTKLYDKKITRLLFDCTFAHSKVFINKLVKNVFVKFVGMKRSHCSKNQNRTHKPNKQLAP